MSTDDQGTNAKRSASEIFAKRQTKTVRSRSDDLTDSLISQDRVGVNDQSDTEPSSLETNLALNLEALEAELTSLPEISNFQLRFESPIKEAIKEYAKENGVTPETLLQGLWIVVLNEYQHILPEAVKEAKLHKRRRARAAELKNSITRLTKLLQ